MIFAKEPQILAAWEEGDNFHVVQGQDITGHLEMCHELREHDEQNGMSQGRQFQHVASFPEIVATILSQEQPEVLQDGKALQKWLKTDIGKQFRTSKDAKPIKGDGLQVIVK